MVLQSSILHQIPINYRNISQELLNIENKNRSNIFSWKGQFSPQFVEVLLKRYSKEDSIIFDPFLGSGTVISEASKLGLQAYGTEINPSAYTLSSLYQFINILPTQRQEIIDIFLNKLNEKLPDNSLPLFNNIDENYSSEGIKSKIFNLGQSFSDSALLKSFYEALIIFLDFDNKKLDISDIHNQSNKLSSLILNLPYSEKKIKIYHADSRQTPLKDSSVNFVITSPPYINVFNYHQQYRKSAEFLGWNVLSIAKSEIGSNRKHRSNRFLTVIQYCLDIALTFQEILRICSPNSRIIFVVGQQSNIRGVSFFNGELVAQIAYQILGLDLVLRQEREFMNRFGRIIKEDILHFYSKKVEAETFNLKQVKQLAINFLELAYLKANNDVKKDIQSAINMIDEVNPSPYYNYQ
ncbi:DNA methyltransferase [Cyanobacterium sp. DS4]|uniref:DNA methyltransferase n=1 Tax=Cyanobacterium sp. DS4 TaxID=2878255 RepID=UPI002E81D903|nr:DNA methyltransferase [Cyanobacterium sp. Dongsha4]WVL00908.1 site-specific DNA-methyltransferase [Cyanobacterium sp. Dongsha4]